MFSRKALGVALTCAALCGCATPSTPFEGHPVLAAIRFEGNKSISSGDLESKIATAQTSGFFKKTPRYYDADLFQIDEKRIVRWYNEKGFYEAKVDDVRTETDDRGRVTLVVQIHEGPRAKVKEVVFEGAADLSGSEQRDLRKHLPIHAGDEFDENTYDAGKGHLVDQLKEQGFAKAAVTGRVLVATEEGIATITYDLDSGPRFVFGQVIVTGNRSVKTDEIVRAAGIHAGDQFKPSKLELAQQRVYNLGTFSGVRVTIEPSTGAAVKAPVETVHINVREAPFETVRLGLGLAAEVNRYEIPRLHAEYTNRNLFGGLRRLELATNLGYAFTPTITDPAGVVTLTTAQLVTPNVLIPGLDFLVRGEGSREIQFGFSYDELAGRAGFLYRYGPHSIAPSINYVVYLKSQLDSSLDISTLIGKGGTAAAALISNCLPTCTLIYPELRYTFDLRDNIVEPHRGIYFTVSVQQTLKPGTFTYFRIEPELRMYVPIGERIVAAGRAYFGALLQPPGTGALRSPFQERFFGGGFDGNRGFTEEGQSPRFGAQFNPKGYATTSVPVGGNGDFLLSSELRIKTDFIVRNTSLVPFVDASTITADPELPFTVPLEIATGLGLRYTTPFGPIRLDVGYLIHAFDVTAQVPGTTGMPPPQPTPVSTGCNESTGTCIHQSRFAFHIALGEAF